MSRTRTKPPPLAPIEWVFDALPPSGARRGGDPAGHVFAARLRTFVREVVQNANDQAIPQGMPEVHFRFHELTGSQLEDVLAAASWNTLRPHLEAAALTRGGRGIKQALAELEQRKKLLVLVIEDRDTVGLTGDEHDGDSHFRALCKDTLYSHKQTEGAGGSFGLGKSVLWSFSGLSTVMFNSRLSRDGQGQVSPRMIGRAELPTHEIGKGAKDWFTGSGWFGRRAGEPGALHAESVWAAEADGLARRLCLERTSEDLPGTSVLVVGFRDPAADEERSVADLAAEIRTAIEHEFWPATVMPRRRLVTWVAAGGVGKMLSDKDFSTAIPFADCYRRRDAGVPVLEAPGDVVVREVPIELPRRRDGSAGAIKGHVRLCVRLWDEQAPHEMLGHVALFRGPGMVVKYLDRRSLAMAARPFHAVLACGLARSPDQPLPSDISIERFLRAAEPPGHDEWEASPTLKAEYERGYAKALELLRKRMDDELKAIVIAQPRQGRQGPDRLRRQFPLGQKGGGGGSPSAFRFNKIRARFEDGRWVFSGEIRPTVTTAQWACDVRVSEVGEDGGELDGIAIHELQIDDAGTVELLHGTARIQTGAPALGLRGVTVAARTVGGSPRAITLEIRSTAEGA